MNQTAIILLMNAVLTIVTTAVVVRLSLNKGSLGITKTIKTKLTPIVRGYIKAILSAALLTWSVIILYRYVSPSTTPTRYEVFVISMNAVATFFWLVATVV